MNRKLKLSLIIIAGLLFFIMISGRVKSPDVPRLYPFDEKNVDELLINRPGSGITIVMKDGRWIFKNSGIRADEKLVSGMISSIKNIRLVDPVSTRGFYEKYDLTPDRSVEVTLRYEGRDVRKVVFGKKGSTGKHTYVTVNSIPAVYLASGIFDAEFGKTPDQLRDRVIFRIEQHEIESVEIRHGYSSVFFERDLSEPDNDEKKAKTVKRINWRVKPFDYKKIRQSEVDTLMFSFNPMTASGFSEFKAGNQGKPEARIIIKSGKKSITMDIFGKDASGRYPCVSSESQYVFLIDEPEAKKFLFKGINDFLLK